MSIFVALYPRVMVSSLGSASDLTVTNTASSALGGLLGGIVGLILAVPATVIASNGIARLRARGSLARVAERAEPTVRSIPTNAAWPGRLVVPRRTTCWAQLLSGSVGERPRPWPGCQVLTILATAIDGLAGEARAAEPGEVKRVGSDPVILPLAADGGARLEVATASDDRGRALGPLAAPAPPLLDRGKDAGRAAQEAWLPEFILHGFCPLAGHEVRMPSSGR